MPHELIGMKKENVAGILLSMEIMQQVEAQASSLANTNKGKQQQRYGKFYAENPKYR